MTNGEAVQAVETLKANGRNARHECTNASRETGRTWSVFVEATWVRPGYWIQITQARLVGFYC